MYSLPVFLDHLVQETCGYLQDIRKDAIDFKLWFDEDEQVYKSQFSYGRVGEGSKTESVCAAIAHAITAIENDVLGHFD